MKSIQFGLTSREKDDGYFGGVFLSGSDDLIGTVLLTEVGRGYMTEAVRLIIGYAFHDLKLHRIEAGVMP